VSGVSLSYIPHYVCEADVIGLFGELTQGVGEGIRDDTYENFPANLEPFI